MRFFHFFALAAARTQRVVVMSAGCGHRKKPHDKPTSSRSHRPKRRVSHAPVTAIGGIADGVRRSTADTLHVHPGNVALKVPELVNHCGIGLD